MEILSQSNAWIPYLIALIIVIIISLVSLFVFIGGVATLIAEKFQLSDFVLTVIFGIISGFMILATIGGFITGPTTYYKAIVTDYNVIYEEGYEIISTDGKIVTLTKE